jgi:hypothetical protein
MFVSISFILAREIVPSPTFFATIAAVSGIACIRPPAPTSERALMMKRDSWRMWPYAHPMSNPVDCVSRSTIVRKGAR